MIDYSVTIFGTVYKINIDCNYVHGIVFAMPDF